MCRSSTRAIKLAVLVLHYCNIATRAYKCPKLRVK